MYLAFGIVMVACLWFIDRSLTATESALEAAGSWLAQQSTNRENRIQFQNREQLSGDGRQTIKKFRLPNNGCGDNSNSSRG
jgi:hypothetical protein